MVLRVNASKSSLHHEVAAQELDRWLASPSGKALLQSEDAMLSRWLPLQTGQRAVAVSAVSGQDFLRHTVISKKIHMATRHAKGCAAHVGLDALPFSKGCLDLLVLHHCHEHCQKPHQLLREASRSITSGGKLVLVGFHPWSLLGLLRWWPMTHNPGWHGHFISPHRLHDWLQVLGFEVDARDSCFHGTPFAVSSRFYRWLSWLGQRLWPRLGASYVLVARKQAGQMTPLRQRQGHLPSVVVPLSVARWNNGAQKNDNRPTGYDKG